jgi:hypothetical protein
MSLVFFLRRHVNPHVASGGGAWRRRAAPVPTVQIASSAIPGFLRVCFCNFYMLEYGFKLLLVVLFNFCILLTCNYIWLYEKKYNRKGCVCVCYFFMLLNYKIKKIKKINLMF